MALLERINFPKDLKSLKRSELKLLAMELREFVIESVSKTGGHLSSNLGVIELTIALHYVYDAPKDKLIWDVGHQTYAHKVLTGRKGEMHTLRKKDGLSGFPRRSESIYDEFGTGHSSTSISAALGVSEALRKRKSKNKAIAIIGYGAMTAGMAFEGLNHAGSTDNNLLVILNDNDMSISKNVGALNNYLARLLTGKLYDGLKKSGKAVFAKVPPVLELARKTEEHMKGMVIPGTLFEEFGFNYVGPIDGHDLDVLIDTLENIKKIDGPQFLHVATKKGFGYNPAQNDPNKFHGVGQFNPVNGQSKDIAKSLTYTQVFSTWLMKAAKKNVHLCAITPAMSDGSGLNEFAKKYPARYYDVGIAEQHALTFAAGLALSGIKPVIAIYSTFLQRAYDQLIHDIAIQNIPMLFAIDRAGLVGADGATHSGNFDISFMRCIPNLILMSPSNESECFEMLSFGYEYNGICAVRYPRGQSPNNTIHQLKDPIRLGCANKVRTGKKVAILAFGPIIETCREVADEIDASLIDMRFIKPIDKKMIKQISKDHELLVSVEENAVNGGAGSAVLEVISESNIACKTLVIGIPDKFFENASQQEVLKACGLDKQSIVRKIVKQLNG